MLDCIERLGPHKLGPRNQIKTFKHVVCVFIYIKKFLPYNENQTNEKPKTVYLLSDFTANQKLHRIYFVQGQKPFQYLE